MGQRRGRPAGKDRTIGPKFGGGVLADRISTARAGKPDAHGIFTYFQAWGFPCHRRANALITVFDMPETKVQCSVSLREGGAGRLAHLADFEIPSPGPRESLTFHLTWGRSFEREGRYELVFKFTHHTGELRLPVEVRTLAWPRFSKAERDYAKSRTDAPKTVRATVTCEGCKAPFFFEESVLKDYKPPPGVHVFPRRGGFTCPKCGEKLELRDLQGQLRSSLKDLLKRARRRG